MTELSQVLIIDDHPLFREALSAAVSLSYPTTRSREVSNVEDAISVLEVDREFDIALLDLNIPGVYGFEGLLKLRRKYEKDSQNVMSMASRSSVMHVYAQLYITRCTML